MKKSIKLLALIAAVVMTVAMFAACGNSTADVSSIESATSDEPA